MKWLCWFVPPTRGGCAVLVFVVLPAVGVVVSQLVMAVSR